MTSLINLLRRCFHDTWIQRLKITTYAYRLVTKLRLKSSLKGEDKDQIDFRGIDLKVDVSDVTYLPTMISGDYERTTLDFFEHMSTESKLFIDVGANIGLFSALYRKNNPRGKLVSFEPIEENYTKLGANLGGSKTATLVKKAVGQKKEKADIYVSLKDSGTHSLRQGGSGKEKREVEVVSLDGYFKPLPSVKKILLKIDVEGYEPEVIIGAKKLLKDKGPVLFIEYIPGQWDKESGDQAIKLLKKHYSSAIIIDNIRSKYRIVSLDEALSVSNKFHDMILFTDKKEANKQYERMNNGA